MILITGAGGKTGRTLIKTLSKVESVCAFVHSQESAAVAEQLGAGSVRVGDLLNESQVRNAIQGARAVYHICPNMHPDEESIGRFVIDEARKAAVAHFVFHSVLHPQTEKMRHHWAKMRVEEALLESGLPFTVLRPAPYMQNILAGWSTVVSKGILRNPYSVEARISLVDLEDVARAAAIVLMQAGHTHATYELAGTPPLNQTEVAEIIGRALGRSVHAEHEPIEAWKARVGPQSAYAAQTLVAMFEYYDRHGLPGNPSVLGWLLERKPTSLQSFIERTMKERDAVH